MDRGEHQMSEWIECNLPWNVYIWENREEFDSQNLDIKEELDAVYKKHFAELEQVRRDIVDVMELDIPKNEYGFTDFDEWNKHPLRDYLDEINETLREIRSDLNDKVIYKELDRRTALYEEKRKQLSFCGSGLNKAGTLIEVNGKQILIGHINELNVDAGCCGGSAFEDKDVVTRYKVIWSDNV